MTSFLAQKAHKVIAVEIDKTLIPILNDTLSNFKNIEIINNDILKLDIKSIAKKYKDRKIKVVANLPYYITTPIIMNMLENRLPIESITVMIQKEVAHRMQATAGTKEYGSLTLSVQYFCTPYLVANVPQNCFIPRPNVDSSVIKLTALKKPPVNVKNLDLMFKLTKVAFSQRRKTLLNCIFNSKDFNFDKSKIINILNEAGFNDKIRGEKLTLESFAKLTEVLEKYI